MTHWKCPFKYDDNLSLFNLNCCLHTLLYVVLVQQPLRHKFLFCLKFFGASKKIKKKTEARKAERKRKKGREREWASEPQEWRMWYFFFLSVWCTWRTRYNKWFLCICALFTSNYQLTTTSALQLLMPRLKGLVGAVRWVSIASVPVWRDERKSSSWS